MGEKLEKLSAAVKSAKNQVVDTAARVAHHPNTEAAAKWAKETATEAAADVADQARKVSKNQVSKDAATGAAIGAVVAVPIPLVGPIFGAIVGAGIGSFVGLKRSMSKPGPSNPSEPTVPFDFHKEMTELDDLRQKGILTQAEFDAQKKKLLRKR